MCVGGKEREEEERKKRRYTSSTCATVVTTTEQSQCLFTAKEIKISTQTIRIAPLWLIAPKGGAATNKSRLFLLSWCFGTLEVHDAAAVMKPHQPVFLWQRSGSQARTWSCRGKAQRTRCCGEADRSPVLRHHAPEIGGSWTGLRGVLRVRANNALRQGGGGCVGMRGFQNLTFRHHEECECFRSLH